MVFRGRHLQFGTCLLSIKIDCSINIWINDWGIHPFFIHLILSRIYQFFKHMKNVRWRIRIESTSKNGETRVYPSGNPTAQCTDVNHEAKLISCSFEVNGFRPSCANAQIVPLWTKGRCVGLSWRLRFHYLSNSLFVNVTCCKYLNWLGICWGSK